MKPTSHRIFGALGLITLASTLIFAGPTACDDENTAYDPKPTSVELTFQYGEECDPDLCGSLDNLEVTLQGLKGRDPKTNKTMYLDVTEGATKVSDTEWQVKFENMTLHDSNVDAYFDTGDGACVEFRLGPVEFPEDFLVQSGGTNPFTITVVPCGTPYPDPTGDGDGDPTDTETGPMPDMPMETETDTSDTETDTSDTETDTSDTETDTSDTETGDGDGDTGGGPISFGPCRRYLYDDEDPNNNDLPSNNANQFFGSNRESVDFSLAVGATQGNLCVELDDDQKASLLVDVQPDADIVCTVGEDPNFPNLVHCDTQSDSVPEQGLVGPIMVTSDLFEGVTEFEYTATVISGTV